MFPAPRARLRRLAPEVSRFALVGSLGYATDVVLFNVLRALLETPSLPAKFISLGVATVIAYLGNRRWTYGDRAASADPTDAAGPRRQFLLFVGWSCGGLAIQVGCLALSRDVLGFDSPLADNISGNLIGMALATAFRFWGYRTWVFRAAPSGAAAVPSRIRARDVPGPVR
ncbi:GtrA family protein [Embleya sp. NPDC008237]|uniref:GtrA family protein n=1 Tax=Embleya sp. NPDC008237 TaxID=3363978 RepID=UPI0036ED281A